MSGINFSEKGEKNHLMLEDKTNTFPYKWVLEELKEFPNIEFIALPLDKLKEKLDNSIDTLARIGSVNLRALEVYDNIKEEYEKIKLKV